MLREQLRKFVDSKRRLFIKGKERYALVSNRDCVALHVAMFIGKKSEIRKDKKRCSAG